jgi:hypothetical protein
VPTRIDSVFAVLIASAMASSAAPAAEQAAPPTNPNFFVYCENRVAATFPGPPMSRDITYRNAGQNVPARQFSFEQGMDHYSVTVADFTNGGPAIDDSIVENAAATIRQRGKVEDQFPEDYSPGIPGRQLNVFDAKGRQYRVSIYMADHRLYIGESYAAAGEFAALQFEQSVLLLDATGGDLNNANPAARQHYPCGK